MTIHDTSSRPTEGLETEAARDIPCEAIGQLFAAALDGNRRAEAALHLLGGFDDTAHRASWALLCAHESGQITPLNVLASIDRTLAALRAPRSALRAPRPADGAISEARC
ncbi:hypothetical protein GCM10023199_42440 [Actinomycetospora chibensis]